MEGQKWTQNRSPEPGVSDSWAAAQCVGGPCPTTLTGRLATAPRPQAEAQSVLQVEMVKSRGLLPGQDQGVQPQWKPEGTLVGMRFRKPNQIHMGISEVRWNDTDWPRTLSTGRPVCLLLCLPSAQEGKVRMGAPAMCPAPAIESSLGVGWIFTEMCPLELACFWPLFAMVLKCGPFSHCDQQLLLKVEELVDFKTVAGTRHHFL